MRFSRAEYPSPYMLWIITKRTGPTSISTSHMESPTANPFTLIWPKINKFGPWNCNWVCVQISATSYRKAQAWSIHLFKWINVLSISSLMWVSLMVSHVSPDNCSSKENQINNANLIREIYGQNHLHMFVWKNFRIPSWLDPTDFEYWSTPFFIDQISGILKLEMLEGEFSFLTESRDF